MNILYARSKDLYETIEIEKRFFEDESWIHDMVADELELRRSDRSTWVLINMGVTTGYVMSSYLDREMQLLNFIIYIPFKKRGYDSTLLNYLLNQVQKKISIILVVKEVNLVTINLYKKVGLKKIAIHANYYDNRNKML
tara:strand:+ start:249 stop:665 length:417 start_codon:yes stop_codon:yes gene_type:complete